MLYVRTRRTKLERDSSRRTNVEKLLGVLRDGNWHRTSDLVRRVGHSFAVAKFHLTRGTRTRNMSRTRYAIQVERDKHARRQFRYRLVGQQRPTEPRLPR